MYALAEIALEIVTVSGVLNGSTAVVDVITVTICAAAAAAVGLDPAISAFLSVDVAVPAPVVFASIPISTVLTIFLRPCHCSLVLPRLETTN